MIYDYQFHVRFFISHMHQSRDMTVMSFFQLDHQKSVETNNLSNILIALGLFKSFKDL